MSQILWVFLFGWLPEKKDRLPRQAIWTKGPCSRNLVLVVLGGVCACALYKAGHWPLAMLQLAVLYPAVCKAGAYGQATLRLYDQETERVGRVAAAQQRLWDGLEAEPGGEVVDASTE